MSMIEQEMATELMKEIQVIEQGTDLKRIAIISRIGMKVASATSDQTDADAETASSSALIDLSNRLTQSVSHGNLREILVKAESGFVILQFINEDFMLFGGIENPLRIGFYLEYLRNAAHKFAYILAGNKVTDALKTEIEANRKREERLRTEANASLTKDFKMDKDSTQDMEAMEQVLGFLKDWEGEEVIKPDQDNIIGIDQDLMFGMDDLAPTPISKDQISKAQHTSANLESEIPSNNSFADIANLASSDKKKSTSIPFMQEDTSMKQGSSETTTIPEKTEISDDIFNALDELTQNAPIIEENKLSIPIPSNEEISDESEDILAVLDSLTESFEKSPSVQQPTKSRSKKKYPFGIPVYEGEVPPIPLDDYVNFEIGTLTATSENSPQTSDSESIANDYKNTIVEPEEFVAPMEFKDDGTPNFEKMSSEYDGLGEELEEEDAMLAALEELDFDS
ncbi:MAG: roadblock/LC7 domain-containing protein, partial [Promethearchaeota archaeon]